MKLRSADDFFIHKLLEETYQSMPENEMSKGSQDLLKYFTEQGRTQFVDDSIDPVLFNFFQQNAIKFIPFKRNSNVSCFRLSTPSGDIDFPTNWSFFERLNQSIEKNANFVHYINRTNDEDLLTEVLNPFNITTEFDIAVISYENQPVLVFFTEDNKEKFNWVKNFLNIESEDRAA